MMVFLADFVFAFRCDPGGLLVLWDLGISLLFIGNYGSNMSYCTPSIAGLTDYRFFFFSSLWIAGKASS